MSTQKIGLRPCTEADLPLFQRLLTEPYLTGLDWSGFRDAREPVRQFEEHGFLRADGGRLAVDADGRTAGFVSWRIGSYAAGLAELAKYWEIGIVLFPEHRGNGIGWRAQTMLCEYLFRHTPVQRIQAGTHPENSAEQHALRKAGFRFEGTVRCCEFRDGQWRDGLLYSRLRSDPAPEIDRATLP
ncbi:GNAT family N-acetyltransferase [Sciscionella marina]|uniref:GNAT family N-acetyltransferase n=1 Tax=Sciscionella marina TaxID=508770 RepID=UPI0003645682|nr:GNAT family protein [Sciscionella marina]